MVKAKTNLYEFVITENVRGKKEAEHGAVFLRIRNDGYTFPVIIHDGNMDETDPSLFDCAIYLTKDMAIELGKTIFRELLPHGKILVKE